MNKIYTPKPVGNPLQESTTKNRQPLQHRSLLRKMKCCYKLSILIALLMLYIGIQCFNTLIFPNDNNRDKKDFASNWRRLMKARTDWKRLLSPCPKNVQLASHVPGWEQGNETSAEKSYISLMDIRKAGEFSTIWFHTRTGEGKEKSIGGDFWRVVFQGPASVAATVFDHENGSYEVIALLVEPGEYNVQMILEHSLCEGLKDPPEQWFRAGNYHGHFQPAGIIHSSDADKYIFKPLEGKSNTTIQVQPKTKTNFIDFVEKSCEKTCVTIGNGYGRWVEDNWEPYHTPELPNSVARPVAEAHLKPSGKLLLYGDSMARYFSEAIAEAFVCSHVFSSCGCSYNWIYPIPDNNKREAEITRNDDFDFRPGLVLQAVRDALRQPEMLSNASLLVINLGLHYAVNINFTSYQQLIYGVINVLKTRKERLGSEAGVIWKTYTYLHKERQKFQGHSSRFFTAQRVQLFDTFAMSLMCKAGIDVLDVYPITASHPGGSWDHVHYKHNVFRKTEKAIEQYALPKFGKNRREVCIG